MKKERKILYFLLIVLAIGFVSASFTFRNENIERVYTGGETIRGFVNISLSSENAHSEFKSNFNGTIFLIDLLKANNFVEGRDYTCSREGCKIDYAAEDEISSITLDNGDNKIIGFKLTGSEIEITSLRLSLSSDASASCERQILIDVLDKNESFIQSMKGSDEICGYKYSGCFDDDEDIEMADVISSEYCERIELPPAPAYMIGAKVENGTKNADLTMKIYDLEWNELGGCKLPKHEQKTQELMCRVNYSNTKEREFFVCISSSEDDAEYKIETENAGDVCGTDNNGLSFNMDYNIFAKAIKFAAAGEIEINETAFSEQNGESSLVDYVNEYISDKYDRNCSAGCIIPFRIYGNSQTITKNSAALKYTERGSLTQKTTSKIYSVEKEDAKISTDKSLYIDISKAGFVIPILSSAKQLYLYLGNRAVLPKPIAINVTPGFDFDITPRIISLGIATTFRAITSEDIVSSTWNFGDGIIESSDNRVITHRYTTLPTDTNEYNLEVSLTRKDGVIAKKTFKIGIAPFAETAANLVNISSSRIAIINSQINAYPPWMAALIKTKLDFDNMNLIVSNSKKLLLNASTDEDYLAIIKSMTELDVPYEVNSKEKGVDISPLIGFGKIDTTAIEQISNKEVSAESRQQLKESIIRWMTNNVDMKIDYEKVLGVGEKESKVLATKFTINSNVKNGEEAYLIINYPLNSIKFGGNYSANAAGSMSYVPVKGQQAIEFAIMDNIDVEDLGMYISPVVDKVYIQAEVVAEKFNWGRFIIWMIILLVFAFAAYIAMQEWYKKNYEKSLFKNKDDLYNLINFIYNAKKGGMNEEELRSKLRDAKWKGEQITYAIRKAEGKRTGMWEIPVFKYWEQLKIKSEIAKRTAQKNTSPQQSKSDAQPIIGQQQNLLKH